MEADFLILADSAQVVGDKLYMLGGGWSVLHAAQLPTVHSMAVAVGILVDWMETNTRHTFKLDIRNEDMSQTLATLEGEFEAGRPPGIPRGSQQRLPLAFNFSLKFENPGQCVARLLIDGQHVKKVSFMVVHEAPGAAPAAPAGNP